MTDEDKKRVEQKNAALTRIQGAMALQNQKHQDDLENIDAKGSAQAGVATVRQVLKSHSEQAINAIEQAQNPASQQNAGGQ